MDGYSFYFYTYIEFSSYKLEEHQKLTNKNSTIEDLEQEMKIQKEKQETLQEEISE